MCPILKYTEESCKSNTKNNVIKLEKTPFLNNNPAKDTMADAGSNQELSYGNKLLASADLSQSRRLIEGDAVSFPLAQAFFQDSGEVIPRRTPFFTCIINDKSSKA